MMNWQMFEKTGTQINNEPVINFDYRFLDFNTALITVRCQDRDKSDMFKSLSESFL